MRIIKLLSATLLVLQSSLIQAATSADEPWQFVTSSDGTSAEARHESAAVALNGKLYLLGGRGTRTIQAFDPVAKSWKTLAPMPIELHHFQPVVIGDLIYAIGGFTCCYALEDSVAEIHVFNTLTNTWTIDGSMPASRVRGSAASVVRNDLIYIIGGNTQGHSGGAVAWFDSYDPATGNWTVLPDAPTPRDHFSAVVVGDKIVAAAGRQTAQPNPFVNAVAQTDIYNFATGSWSTTTNIPTLRAGALAVAAGDEVIVAGGEINTTSTALDKVEAMNVSTGEWRTLQPLNTGRHSGGGIVLNSKFYVVAGATQTGGAPETNTLEALEIDETSVTNDDLDSDGLTNDAETSIHGTNPNLADTDSDGLDDGLEVNTYNTNPLIADTDSDGLSDGDEVTLWKTDPTLSDTDNDGLDDYAEVTTYMTDPLVADTDADGIVDGEDSFPLDADKPAENTTTGTTTTTNSSGGSSGGSVSILLLIALLVGTLSRIRSTRVNLMSKLFNSSVSY